MINTLLTCRGRGARFNNNRDIAMIRTGKTRSADVDILKGSRIGHSTQAKYRGRLCTLLADDASRQISAALSLTCTAYNSETPAFIGSAAGPRDRSAMPVSGFHSCCLGPRSIRDLIFQLPTASVCSSPRFLSLLPNSRKALT